MKATKKIKIGIGAVLILVLILFFHFNLPRTAVVQISGTDIKRVDKDGRAKEQVNAAQTTDVRYINSVSRKGKPMVLKMKTQAGGGRHILNSTVPMSPQRRKHSL